LRIHEIRHGGLNLVEVALVDDVVPDDEPVGTGFLRDAEGDIHAERVAGIPSVAIDVLRVAQHGEDQDGLGPSDSAGFLSIGTDEPCEVRCLSLTRCVDLAIGDDKRAAVECGVDRIDRVPKPRQTVISLPGAVGFGPVVLVVSPVGIAVEAPLGAGPNALAFPDHEDVPFAGGGLVSGLEDFLFGGGRESLDEFRPIVADVFVPQIVMTGSAI